jgi:hypothetical protein
MPIANEGQVNPSLNGDASNRCAAEGVPPLRAGSELLLRWLPDRRKRPLGQGAQGRRVDPTLGQHPADEPPANELWACRDCAVSFIKGPARAKWAGLLAS